MKPIINIDITPNQLYELLIMLKEFYKLTSYEPANELSVYFRDQLARAFGLKGGETNVGE